MRRLLLLIGLALSVPLSSIPAAAASLAMLGTGVGGLAMGWLAERIGTRFTVMMGAVMMCAGLILSSGGEVWQLYLGHGLLVGFLGNGAINAEEWKNWIGWAEQNRVSWITWSVSDKDETCSVLYPTAAAEGGWTDKDLKESGRMARALLLQYNKGKPFPKKR